jgi:sugar phosphate permease
MAAAETVLAPAGRARWTRLIPVAIIVYIISFMDRTNIGFAFDGMGKDLHLDSAAQGLAGGIFFIGYLAGPGLRVLDDEHRHLLDHHRAAVRLDPDLG